MMTSVTLQSENVKKTIAPYAIKKKRAADATEKKSRRANLRLCRLVNIELPPPPQISTITFAFAIHVALEIAFSLKG